MKPGEYNLQNCHIKTFNSKWKRVICKTWEEFKTTVQGDSEPVLDICCNEGYKFQKTADDGKILYKDWSGTTEIPFGGEGEIRFTYNPMSKYTDETRDTEVRIEGFYSLDEIAGIVTSPKSLAPPKPDKPPLLKIFPKETFENAYIDNWRITRDMLPGGGVSEPYRYVESFDTVKDFLINTNGRYKKRLTFQAKKGFNFNIDDSDGYIEFFNGEKYTFKQMFDQGTPVGEQYTEPDDRNQVYPNAKKFVYMKGEEYSDGVDEYIVIKKYDGESIDLDLGGRDNAIFFITNGKNVDDTAPLENLEHSKIKSISVHALKEMEVPDKNNAFTTYIVNGEQLDKLKKSGTVYNEMIMNTYSYPIKIPEKRIIQSDMKIGTADINLKVGEFKSIITEIPIFEFDIPHLPGVRLVTIYPIHKLGISVNYETIRGKHLKGISVYDSLSNANVLKLYADDILIDYFDYTIQAEIPINWEGSKLENNGNIGERIPYFKSFVIILYDELHQVSKNDSGYIMGSVENLDSLILRDELEMMNQLVKEGIYFEDSKKTN